MGKELHRGSKTPSRAQATGIWAPPEEHPSDAGEREGARVVIDRMPSLKRGRSRTGDSAGG